MLNAIVFIRHVVFCIRMYSLSLVIPVAVFSESANIKSLLEFRADYRTLQNLFAGGRNTPGLLLALRVYHGNVHDILS